MLESYQTNNIVDAIISQHFLLIEQTMLILNELQGPLLNDCVQALSEPGKILSKDYSDHKPTGLWSLLTLHTALYISPQLNILSVARIAIAVELFVCAADLFDDIEDEDQTQIFLLLGPSRTLNVALTFYTLAKKCILSSKMSKDIIIFLLETLSSNAIVSLEGQHEDLFSEKANLEDFSKEQCLEIVSKKSGALMQLPFQFGAIMGGADEHVCQKFKRLGNLLGIAYQLDNDAHDLRHILSDENILSAKEDKKYGRRVLKSDILRQKKTLPVVIANQLRKQNINSSTIANISESEMYYEGIAITWGISLLYRERANNCLQELEKELIPSPFLRFLTHLE